MLLYSIAYKVPRRWSRNGYQANKIRETRRIAGSKLAAAMEILSWFASAPRAEMRKAGGTKSGVACGVRND